MDIPFQSHHIQDIVYKKHKSTLYSIINGVFKSFHFTKNWQPSRSNLNKNLINKGRIYLSQKLQFFATHNNINI